MIDNITEALKLIKVISKQFNIVCNDGSKPNRNEEITKMEDSLSELNTHLISIKTDCIELTKVNTKLEKQLSEYTDWEKKKLTMSCMKWLVVFLYIEKRQIAKK